MNFDEAFDTLIGFEGNFTDDSRDAGNWTKGVVGKGTLGGTKYGISCSSYPSLDIKNITLDQAKAIYKTDYWDKLHLDQLDPLLTYDLFDTSVNSGPVTAIKLLQEAIGSKVDGKVGPDTMLGVRSLKPETVKRKFNAYRLLFMTKCKGWPTYSKGWTVRVANNLLRDA